MGSMDSSKHATNYNRASSGYVHGSNAYTAHYGARAPATHGYGMHHNSAAELAALAHNFQGVNLQNQGFQTQGKNHMIAATPTAYGGLPIGPGMAASLYTTSPYVFPNSYGTTTNTQSPSLYTPHASHFMSQMAYNGYQTQDGSSHSQAWTTPTGITGEVPTLITPRRDSVSSNENDQPATPSYANYHSLAHGGVAINRAPSGMYTHGTSSPTSMVAPYGISVPKHSEQIDVSPRIKMLINSEPPIPHAIPAPSSPLKPLDRALENQRGETNVYIRGLLPETTDEMLEAWGSRFGDIKSSKSIIDLNTSLCKGFGFVKYHNYEDAENCIRGFHYLGYEVSFARESFYSKLKAFADENNTNLYVSNLPKAMNEHELAQLFHPFKVCSSRILRDKNGHARGVGFARFETREACEEVIKTYNNHTLKSVSEELQIQIRFADTQEQKSLKQQTQAARQFRSAEYEFATQAWRQGHNNVTGTPSSESSDFEQFHNAGNGVPISNQRWIHSALRQMPGRSPLGNHVASAAHDSTPLVQVNIAPGSEAHLNSGVNITEKDAKTGISSTTVAHTTKSASSVTLSDHE